MKKYFIYVISFVFVAYFVYIFSYTLDPKLDLNGDNAHYIQLANNMANGHGYAYLRQDGSTTIASHFPPGYSAILSIFVFFGIQSLLAFKIINGIFLFLSLCILAYIVYKLTNQKYLAVTIASLTVLSPQVMHFAGIVMSEMSYLLSMSLSFFSLYLYQKQDKKNEFYKNPWFYTSVLFALGAYYIRTVGASIIFAVFIFYLFRKEWLAAVSSVIIVVLGILPWSLRNSAAGIESRYFGTIMTVNPWRPEEGTIKSFGEFIDKMIVNIDETVIKGFKEILFPFMSFNYNEASGLFAIIGGIFILAIMIFGAWKMKTFRWFIIAFFAANIGLFALWHGGNGSRYVVPIAPFIYILFYAGVYYCVKVLLKDKVKANSFFMLIPLFMVFPMIEPIKQLHNQASQPYLPAYQNYFKIAEQMEDKAKSTYVVCCRKPELFNYYAPSMRTTNYLYSNDVKALIINMIEKKVDYVVLDQLGYSSTGRYLYPAIQQNIELFPVAAHFPNPDTYLLKFELDKAKEKFGLK